MTRLTPLAVLSIVAALCPAAQMELRAQTAAQALQLGQPIEREISGGMSHSYRVQLESGQFLFAVVEQRGIDIVITAFGPHGEPLGEFDSPNGSRGLEPISIIAESSGAYRLDVRPFSSDAEPGRYVIRIERLQAAATTPEGQVDQLFLPWDRPNSPGAAVAVVKDGAVVYQRGFGSANLEHGIPITPSTVFDIASVSKQFTGLAVAMLVEQGAVSLDADIREYLPEMPDFGETVTVRHLVHHTSGLRDWTAALPIAGVRFEDVITFDDVLAMARHQRDLNYTPGAEYSYTNTGYNLLAEIVSRVTGEPFADWMQANVFEPLGMTSTHFHGDYHRIVRNRAHSYRPDLERGGFQNAVNTLTALGSSSLYTTTEDLAKWALNFEEMRVAGPAAIALTHQRGVLNSGDTIGYAFGQGIGRYRGLRTVSHGGSWAGFRTYLVRFPEQRCAVIVLANLSSFNPTLLANRVADAYLPEELEPAQATEEFEHTEIAVDPARLDDYLGSFKLGPGWFVTFTKEDGRLMAQATRERKFPMTAESEDLFWVEDYGAHVFFQRDTSGVVTNIRYRGIQAPRVELVTPGPEQLAEYGGSYYSEELGTSYEIVVQDGALFARHRRYDDVALTPGPQDEFSGELWFLRGIRFTRGPDDRVTGFLVTSGRVRNLRFDRVDGRSR